MIFFMRIKKKILFYLKLKKHKKNLRFFEIKKRKQEKLERKKKKEFLKNIENSIKLRNLKIYNLWKLKNKKFPFIFEFLKWIYIDKFIYHTKKANWGIYLFVANPGEGKTLSMVKHIEEKKKENPGLKIYTNFNYKGETDKIKCWQDIVKAEKNSIIAIDEAHLTFESTDFKNFPVEILSQLSLNRKLRKQFICSTQRYERLNKNFRDLANYVVLCKNVLKSDRWFTRYYYSKSEYDKQFDGKRSKADFVRPFIATDSLRNKYNTLDLVSVLSKDIEIKEKNNDLLNLLDDILSLDSNLTQNEIKSLFSIKSRVSDDILKQAIEHEKNKLFDEVEFYNKELRKNLEKVIKNS